ncbi:MAG: glycosyltransferase [Kiritimatiellia bacterium]
MSRRADQLLAGFAEGDAISRDALLLRETFRGLGLESDIFVPIKDTDPSAAEQVRPLEAYGGKPGDIALLHDVLAPEAVGAFLAAPVRRVLRYHNITPAAYFDAFDGALAARLRAARTALRAVAESSDAVWSASAFNAAELADWNVRHNRVLPLLYREERGRIAPDPEVLARMAGPLKTVLFVGRLAPNKRVEDLILAFHAYHRGIRPQSRLVIAGSERSCPRYAALLRLLAHALRLPNVCFEGFSSPAGLAALYARADLFVSASEHEGYCLPLVEAMANGVPVLARKTGGMPEALGGAGLLYDDLSPALLGELMDEAIHRPDVRGAMLESQAKRMAAIRARNPADEVKALLAAL